jgi:hypothetical protein
MSELLTKRELRKVNNADMLNENGDTQFYDPTIDTDTNSASKLYKQAIKQKSFGGSFKSFLDYFNTNKDKIAKAVAEGVNIEKSFAQSLDSAKGGGYFGVVNRDGSTLINKDDIIPDDSKTIKSNVGTYIVVGVGALLLGYVVFKIATKENNSK